MMWYYLEADYYVIKIFTYNNEKKKYSSGLFSR